jgi:hypothetical protein
MKPICGFVFFSTLCIISVVSLLILTLMQHILMYHQAINKQEKQHQEFYQLERVAGQLAQVKLELIEPSCVRHTDSANKTLQELFHHKGCPLRVGKVDYQYLIEDLGPQPCLVIGEKQYTSYHDRISVALFANVEVVLPVLQIRYIKPGPNLSCINDIHHIKSGISSWRYFSDYSG